MSQEILNVSTPNSGLGDALRDASIKSNNNFTELYEDKVDKVIGKDLSSNDFTNEYKTKIDDLEANAQVNVQSDWNENDIEADAYIKNKPEQLFSSLGYFDYADLATQTTPISLTSNVQTLLTNDTEGDNTNETQPPYGVSSVWDATTNSFDFSQLAIGDTVDIRIHTKVTTTGANHSYHIDLKSAIGTATEFENRIFQSYVKTASVDEQSFVTSFYIGSSDVRDFPSQLYMTSDGNDSVKVVGWFIRVFRKSVNIVDIITEEAPIDGLTYGRKDAEWVEITAETLKQYKFLLSQSGGDDPQTATSGTLTQGVTYEILTFEGGTVTSFTNLVGGSSYSEGTDIGVFGGSGTGLIVNLIISSGVVTSVSIVDGGIGYQVGDVVNINGGDDNATITISAVSGDDFTLSGAPNNNVGTKWIANGFAPTWSNGSEIGWNNGIAFITRELTPNTTGRNIYMTGSYNGGTVIYPIEGNWSSIPVVELGAFNFDSGGDAGLINLNGVGVSAIGIQTTDLTGGGANGILYNTLVSITLYE